MSTGNQHQRKRFSVPAAGENQDRKALADVCTESGHIPSGPTRARVCLRCGNTLRPPSLEEVSQLMNAPRNA